MSVLLDILYDELIKSYLRPVQCVCVCKLMMNVIFRIVMLTILNSSLLKFTNIHTVVVLYYQSLK